MTRVIVAAFSLIACSGNEGGTDDTASTAEVACDAIVDGQDWSAAPELAFWSSYHADSLTLSCALADSTSGIVVNIAGYSGEGSYALTDGQTYAQFNGGALSTDPGAWLSTSGTVEITRDAGGVVEGTLTFQGTDSASGTTKSITDGVFVLRQ